MDCCEKSYIGRRGAAHTFPPARTPSGVGVKNSLGSLTRMTKFIVPLQQKNQYIFHQRTFFLHYKYKNIACVAILAQNLIFCKPNLHFEKERMPTSQTASNRC